MTSINHPPSIAAVKSFAWEITKKSEGLILLINGSGNSKKAKPY